jgi:undecaprenyl-diphosphatase
MFEAMVLGFVQGIVEWLPVSSEGAIVLTKIYFFDGGSDLSQTIELALFLHLGTFFSALVYFYKDVRDLIFDFFQLQTASKTATRTIVFLIIATAISGVLGYGLMELVKVLEHGLTLTGKGVTGLVGVLLLVTGITQLRAGTGGTAKAQDLSWLDGIILGLAQGMAALPGISRSGMTVSSLLLLDYEEEEALRLSFLLSLPIVLGANIVLNLDRLMVSASGFAGLMTAFLSGLLTIHLLLEVARNVNFGYFVLFFGLLTIGAAFI